MTGSPNTPAVPPPPQAARARLPELLAPAGDWDCARAAVENGADAIYFGLDRFNARIRANNFTEADLRPLMEFLHRRGLKGYLTFNTLIFENELAQAESYLRTLIAAGVDAAVVQDVGICRLIRQLSPDFPIHASTQMTVTSAAGLEFARELGCNLVVLARECSVREIETLLSPAAPTAPLPLEVFVHGALCVAYSGQCLTSEALGGRSANRGECAQACRMPYDLLADGQQVPLGDRKYLLSPQDLAGLSLLPELARAGVVSLKIEGRLKSPEYVANITRVYRQALDALGPEARPGGFAPESHRYELEMAFSRGLHTGWFGGINNQQLVHARFGKKRGVYLGQVAEVRSESVLLKPHGPMKPGDGIVFDAGKPEEREEGGRIYEIRNSKPEARKEKSEGKPGGVVQLFFGHGDIDFRKVHAGDRVWKTSDPELERRLRQSFEGQEPKFQRPISIAASGAAGGPLKVSARDGAGHTVELESAMPLVAALKQPLSEARLREQLGRLGGTPFRLGELHCSLSGPVLLPLSELNRLRRELAARLEAECLRGPRWTLSGSASALAPCPPAKPATPPQLIVLVRTLEQLQAALGCNPEILYCDFEDPKKYRDAVKTVRSGSGPGRPEIFVAPPRIFKSGEDWVLKLVRSSEADGYLVRNYEHLRYFAGERRIGDYSLNVANHLAAEYFKSRYGLERLTASYDLNFSQLEALLQGAPPQWFEITLHQHMPMFHMEHCVFCAFLSQGTDYTNCGRPCEKHQVQLRDRVGCEHPVKADAGCRNTVFNSLAQSGAEYASQMLELGVRHYRVEFLNESPQQVTSSIAKYRQLLRGEIDGARLWRELKLLSQLGVTRGQMAG